MEYILAVMKKDIRAVGPKDGLIGKQYARISTWATTRKTGLLKEYATNTVLAIPIAVLNAAYT